MGPEVVFYSLAMLFIFVILGIHIGISLGIASVIGVYLSYGDLSIALSILGSTAYDSIRSNTLAVIPLFMLMGEIISRSGAANDLYLACDKALKRLPGRLAAATVIGNAAFAAVSGVSIAAAATFSRIAYPEMRKAGYDKSYALGVITGCGCLGMLIPPSILLIVWAILTEASVGALFFAGVVPGLLLGLTFILYCIFMAIRNPSIAPRIDAKLSFDNKPSKDSSLVSAIGIFSLIVLVLGGIWLGVFTPTEAAGFGVLGSIILGFIKGMRFQAFKEAIFNAGRSTAPIMFLLIAGSMYAKLLAVSGGINMLQALFLDTGLSVLMIIIIMTVIWLLLGALVDSISIILLTVPIFVPIAVAAGINEVVFAIYGILIIEAGLLTPPMGLLVFTVKASVPDPDVTLSDIFRGSIPYWLMILLVASLIMFFPNLSLWLPNLLL
jgi:tripartite ATP-independent transporter DctM subunit|tara:strand:- start:30357 stop:31673 length:1317 start_codon:yes stop_codon:yes gene_type:complete